MNNLPVGIVDFDIDSRKMVWSKGSLKNLGFEEDRLRLTNVNKIIDEEGKLTTRYRIIKKLFLEKHVSGSFWRKNSNNPERFYIDETPAKSYQLLLIDPSLVCDLSQNYAFEQYKIKRLLDFAPIGFVLIVNGKIRYFNRKIAHFLGFAEVQDLKQKSIFDFITEIEWKKINEFFECQSNNEENIPVKPIIKLKDRFGNEKYWELVLSCVHFSDIKCYQSIVIDKTEDVEKANIQRQIAANLLYINQINQVLCDVKNALNIIIDDNHYSKEKFSGVLDLIDSYTKLDKDWKLFIIQFEKVHPGFFNRLVNNFPNLSVNELKHCACLKMNFDTSETARFFNIKSTSVQIARVRLKKKLKLSADINLRAFLFNF